MLKSHHYVLSVYHRVADLEAARRFLADALGFEVRASGPGWISMENGALAVRLLEEGEVGDSLELELRTPNLADSERALLTVENLVPLDELREVQPGRCERRYAGPQGIHVVLVRQLSDEEMGVDPPLPASLPWDSAAEDLAQKALRFVPYSFRAGALRRAAARAEMLALAHGEVEVAAQDCLQALLDVTPEFQLERLRAELRALGWPLPDEMSGAFDS